MLIPDIETDIPLPAVSAEPLSELTAAQEIEMRARTIKLLADLKGEPLIPSADHAAQAEEIAREMVSNPRHRPDFAKYPNETMAYLAGMVAQCNCMIVDELSDLKLYVVNKLVAEVEAADDTKARISALKLLGEVDGVDAFKRRSELTVQMKPLAEVEKELLSVLDTLEVIEGEYEPVSNAKISDSTRITVDEASQNVGEVGQEHHDEPPEDETDGEKERDEDDEGVSVAAQGADDVHINSSEV